VGHENRVSCLGVSNDGISLCTGSWDAQVSTPTGEMDPSKCSVTDNPKAQGVGLLIALLMPITICPTGYPRPCAAREEEPIECPFFCP
jgi:hypothetical protein